MTETPQRHPRRPRVPLAAQPYRTSFRTTYLAFMLVLAVVLAVVLVIANQARFSPWWLVPFALTAAALYAHRREHTAANRKQGSLWTLAQLGLTVAAFASIALPAKF